MKTKYLTGILIVLMSLGIISCKKDKIANIEFKVNLEKNTFKAGEPVVFNLEGNPDFLSFYSGELGNDYAFLGGRKLDIKAFSLSFQNRVANGNQPNQFGVYISSDFNGIYDIESIRAGNFKDITNLVTLSTVNTVYVESGELDLTPMVEDKSKPFYVAFRYNVKPQTAASGPNGTQRNWSVRNLVFNTVTDLGNNTVMDQLSAGWKIVEFGSLIEPGRTTVSNAGVIIFRGNATAAGKLVETETWAISKAVDLNTITLPPDVGTPIKNISENIPAVYSHTYTEPGVYNVTFETSNYRIGGNKKYIKQVQITIEP